MTIRTQECVWVEVRGRTRHKEGLAHSNTFEVLCSDIIFISNPDQLGGLILLPRCTQRNTHFPLNAKVTHGVLRQSCAEKLYSTCMHMFGPVPSPCFPSDQKHIYLQLFLSQKNKESFLDFWFFKISSRPCTIFLLNFNYDILLNLFVQIEHKEKFAIDGYEYLLLQSWSLISSSSLPFSPLCLSPSHVWLVSLPDSPNPSLLLSSLLFSNNHSQPKASHEIGKLFFNTSCAFLCNFSPLSSPPLGKGTGHLSVSRFPCLYKKTCSFPLQTK